MRACRAFAFMVVTNEERALAPAAEVCDRAPGVCVLNTVLFFIIFRITVRKLVFNTTSAT